MMTHVKLLSVLGAIALFFIALFGGFGVLAAKIVGYTAVGLILLGVYFFIHEVTFSDPPRDGGFS